MVLEAMGALNAAEFCYDVGLHNDIMEGDSLLVVNVIKDYEPNWSWYRQIMEDTKRILQTLGSWQICHTRNQLCCPWSSESYSETNYGSWMDERYSQLYP